jgi:Domain of unknown function (DUF397)
MAATGADMDLCSATWRKSSRSSSNGGECVEVTVVTGRA